MASREVLIKCGSIRQSSEWMYITDKDQWLRSMRIGSLPMPYVWILAMCTKSNNCGPCLLEACSLTLHACRYLLLRHGNSSSAACDKSFKLLGCDIVGVNAPLGSSFFFFSYVSLLYSHPSQPSKVSGTML